MTDQTKAREFRALLETLASKPLSTEDTSATWCPPDWEDIVRWYDEMVTEARQLTGKKYR